MEIKYGLLQLSKLKETTGNPQKMSSEVFSGLKQSLRSKGWLLDDAVVWEREAGEYQIISGHHRVRAALEVGIIEGYCKILKGITEEQAKKLVLEANQRKGELDEKVIGSFLNELIDDYDLSIEDLGNDIGINEEEINKILNKKENEKEKGVVLEPFLAEEVVKKEIEKADNVFFSISGGLDSSLAMVKTLPLLKENQKVEALFVSSNVEFPGLFLYIKDFCESYNVKLKVLLANTDFLEYFDRKKQFPDVIFRNCIELLINKPLDEYIKKQKGVSILVRGGRASQKTSVSKSNVLQEIKKGSFTVRLLNPIFSLTKEEYEKERVKIKQWEGYDKGFERTACWCCPFQRIKQWEALKKEYPGLWQKMFELTRRWEFKERKGDSTLKRFKEYWEV